MQFQGYTNGRAVTGIVSKDERETMQANPVYQFIRWVEVKAPKPAKLSENVSRSVRKAKKKADADTQE